MRRKLAALAVLAVSGLVLGGCSWFGPRNCGPYPCGPYGYAVQTTTYTHVPCNTCGYCGQCGHVGCAQSGGYAAPSGGAQGSYYQSQGGCGHGR
ncbi:MAG: hypothetical protein HYY93_04720 [Planctomycetes bacterium]|nr:hypothetical protein [Planctomycetota bacterium]